MARVEGFEPPSTVLETGMLPLHHTHVLRHLQESNLRESFCRAPPNHSAKVPIEKKFRVFRAFCDIINTSESPNAFLTVSGIKIIPYSFTTSSLVGMGRLELPTLRVSDECSNQLSYIPICGTPRRSRTFNLLIRSQALYPIELSVQIVLCTGVEPVFHP